VTWLGHATVLIQDGPVNIITDPVFVDRIVTYSRLVEKPVDLKSLPRIDIVLISHDHSDHFDEEAVRYLVDRDNATVIVGKNSKDLLPSKAASRILDLDWTEEATVTKQNCKYKIHFLPSCHWSGRGLTDHFKRLWGGFLVVTPEDRKIYYPGDTGYEEGLFKEIG
jgi:L-ascorbate metabolism protein UlaG (beta-lactamase superfamily)